MTNLGPKEEPVVDEDLPAIFDPAMQKEAFSDRAFRLIAGNLEAFGDPDNQLVFRVREKGTTYLKGYEAIAEARRKVRQDFRAPVLADIKVIEGSGIERRYIEPLSPFEFAGLIRRVRSFLEQGQLFGEKAMFDISVLDLQRRVPDTVDRVAGSEPLTLKEFIDAHFPTLNESLRPLSHSQPSPSRDE